MCNILGQKNTDPENECAEHKELINILMENLSQKGNSFQEKEKGGMENQASTLDALPHSCVSMEMYQILEIQCDNLAATVETLKEKLAQQTDATNKKQLDDCEVHSKAPQQLEQQKSNLQNENTDIRVELEQDNREISKELNKAKDEKITEEDESIKILREHLKIAFDKRRMQRECSMEMNRGTQQQPANLQKQQFSQVKDVQEKVVKNKIGDQASTVDALPHSCVSMEMYQFLEIQCDNLAATVDILKEKLAQQTEATNKKQMDDCEVRSKAPQELEQQKSNLQKENTDIRVELEQHNREIFKEMNKAQDEKIIEENESIRILREHLKIAFDKRLMQQACSMEMNQGTQQQPANLQKQQISQGKNALEKVVKNKIGDQVSTLDALPHSCVSKKMCQFLKIQLDNLAATVETLKEQVAQQTEATNKKQLDDREVRSKELEHQKSNLQKENRDISAELEQDNRKILKELNKAKDEKFTE